MRKKVLQVRFPAVIAGTLLLAFSFLPGAFCQEPGASEVDCHNRQGMEYFKKGFYDNTPRKQTAEAQQNYALAIQEFKSAIGKDSSSTEAHRNLARVYYVQKNFARAAAEYQKVTELAPEDLDAYINLALALIELKRTPEAMQALDNAKAHTDDLKALTTIDSYRAKLRQYQEKEVR